MAAAFVLGNGRSRLAVDPADLAKAGPIYGCNALYREVTPTVLVATDRPIATAIQNSGYASRNRFYTRKPIPGLGAQVVPQQYFGFSSGPIAVALAVLDLHDPVYLIGFDMGALPGDRFNNVYADTEFYKPSSGRPTYTGNWIRQLARIAQDHPRTRLIRVVGAETATIPQLTNITNFLHLPLGQLTERLNTPKDF